MKTSRVILIELGLTLPAITFGQDADQPPPPGRGERLPPPRDFDAAERADRPFRPGEGRYPSDGRRPPPPPLIAALDVNRDGIIDADEIAKAAESLRKLDRNGDGELTMDELRPPHPEAGPAPGQRGHSPERRPHRE